MITPENVIEIIGITLFSAALVIQLIVVSCTANHEELTQAHARRRVSKQHKNELRGQGRLLVASGSVEKY